MTENSNIHWTDDDELLSKYVLHRLDSTEKARLSKHLETCEMCRTVVANEQRLVAGATLAGRRALKERLNARLELDQRATAGVAPAKSNIPWMRIASLAAVFLVLVTVGVYNNWFDANTWNKPAIPEQVIHEQRQAPVEMRSKDETQALDNRRMREDRVASHNSVEKDRPANHQSGKTEQAKEKKALDKSDDRFAQSLSAPTTSGVEPDAAAGQRTESEPLLADQATIASAQTFWIEGRVIQAETRQLVEKHAPLAEERNYTYARKQVPSKLKKDADQSLQSRLNTTASEAGVSLNQMPSSSLPLALQLRQSQTGIVQTFIENNANTLQMTIYLDSLMPDSELQAAGVETIGEDSLILILPNQQIGYKLPPAVQSQVNTKARR